ncbi:MAG: hypothetical protein ACKVQC_05950, partial [Elusimicrobiota bacterium]
TKDEDIKSFQLKIDVLKAEVERRIFMENEFKQEIINLKKNLDKEKSDVQAKDHQIDYLNKEFQLSQQKIKILEREIDNLKCGWEREKTEWRELWERGRESWENLRAELKNKEK